MITIDLSGSMSGKRLNAVKVGLCCLAASLKATDTIQLMSFADSVLRLTDGSVPVANFLQILPSLLVCMQASGSTSFYDALTEGFAQLPVSRPSIDCADPIHITRNIFLALTDGEDTASSANSRTVHRIKKRLKYPQ